MNLFSSLVKTYDANISEVGKIRRKYNGTEYTLLPLSHITQLAHIEVIVTRDGRFHGAYVIEGERNTIIPANEKSSIRTSGIAPHPLHDKLFYVAKDLPQFSKVKEKRLTAPAMYLQQLHDWQDSSYTHADIQSIYKYLESGTLTSDLIKCGLLHVGEDGSLIQKWSNKEMETPEAYKLVGDIHDLVIRFKTYEGELAPWENPELWTLYNHYLQSQSTDLDICYVLGKELPAARLHPKKIRHTADMAKLVSSKGNTLIFNGRFIDANEPFAISSEASQKAYNALMWLINRNSFTIDGRVLVIWSDDDVAEDENWLETTVKYEPSKVVRSLVHGHNVDVSQVTDENVKMLLLDAATQGRMAVLQYNEFRKSTYLSNILAFYERIGWPVPYLDEEKKLCESPHGTILDYSKACTLEGANDTIKKDNYTKLLLSVFYNKPIPRPLIQTAYRMVVRERNKNSLHWRKQLALTCGLVKAYKKSEGYFVQLDKTRTERDYLFGRLLAIAIVLERSALPVKETRETNGERYFETFSQKPAKTWYAIQRALLPYQKRLDVKLNHFYQKQIDEVFSMFQEDDFNNRPLKETFLLGFYSQRKALYTKQNTNESVGSAHE